MNKIILGIALLINSFLFSQVPNSQPQPDCQGSEPVCNDNGTTFQLSSGTNGAVDDLPTGTNFSNPSVNPGAAGNSGCMFSGELNPNWFVINIGTSGILEFTIGSAGGNGFYDWSLWPYYESGSGACSDIQNNLLAPVACNWNGSSAGFTGMYAQGSLPPGATQSNFEFGIPVVAGEQYVLLFSNYSSGTGNVPLTFGNNIPGNSNPNSSTITCTPNTPDQSICIGSAADVTIVVPPVITNPTFNWLVTTNVSDPTGGVNVMVSPTVTTEYRVEIFENGVYAATDTFTIYVEVPPVPDAGMDQIICKGVPVTLNGSSSDPANSIAWSHNISSVVPTPTVVYTPNSTSLTTNAAVNQAGTYLFILTETNPVCGAVKDTVELFVDDVIITGTSTPPSCFGFSDGTINLTSIQAVEYSFDNGTTWGASSSSSVFAAGTYNVCGRSVNGCVKCTSVTVVDPPQVTISTSNDTLICQNGTAYMSASATGGTSYDFHWSHTTDLAAQQNVNPLAATTYTVYAENQNGCVSPNATIDVTVRAPITGSISSWDTICPGYPTNIMAVCTGGIGTPYTFNWSSGDSFSGVANHQIEVNPPITTNYTVTITDECESTPLIMTTNVRVAPLPVPAYEVLDPIQCEPAIFHIVNKTNPTLSQYNYWLFDNQQQFVNQDTIVTDPMLAGTYDLQMIITTYEGCVDSLTFENAVGVIPKPEAKFQHSPNPVLMFNTNVFFTNLSVGAINYEWSFEEGLPSQSNQPNVHVRFPDGETGRYDVMLVATSELGCIDTLNYELIVFPEVLIYAPNAFTPDGDELNQTWQVYMEGVDIYDFNLLIFNRWGEVVWESNDITVPWDGVFNGKLLPAGTYNWAIRTKDQANDAKYTYNGSVSILK